MIKVYYNKELNEVYLKITASIYFDDILSIFKQHGIKYDKELNASVCHPKRFLDAERDLLSVETLEYPDNDYERIKNILVAPANLKSYRKVLHPELYKFKPLEAYQTEGTKFLVTHEAGILGLPCGSGKTWIIVSAITELLHTGDINKILIISTRSSLYNWQREIQKFSDIDANDIQIVRAESNRKVFDIYADKKILIIDYDSFKIISEHYTALSEWSKKKLKAVDEKKRGKVRDATEVTKTRIDFNKWNPNNKAMIVCDEVHKIKNNSGRSAHVIACANSDNFIRRYGASGTLLPRDFTDSFNSAKFMSPSIYFEYPRSTWEKDVCEYNNPSQKYTMTGFNEEKMKLYRERFDRYCFNRTEAECFGDRLPEYVPRKIYVEMTEEMTTLYDDISVRRFQNVLDINGYLKPSVTINVFPYLMLMLSDVKLIKKTEVLAGNEEFYNDWKITDSPKYQAMIDIIEEHLEDDPCCKIAVASYHPYVLDELSKHCKYKNLVLHGENTKGKDKDDVRDSAIEQFKKNDEKIFFLSGSIFAESINLTEINVHINYDVPFEFDKFFQLSRRFYRTGQVKKTYRYDLIYDKSFEIIQHETLNKRFDLNRIVNNFEMLTLDEWKRLKNGDLTILDELLEKIDKKHEIEG